VCRAGDELFALEDMTTWHRREAEETELTGRWFTAQWHLQRLLEVRPKDGDLLRRCGLALARLDDRNRAAEMLTRAIAHGGDSAEVRLERGNLFARSGERDRAEAEFGDGLEKWPESWALLYARGSLRADERRWRKAAEDLGRAAKSPDAPAGVGGQYALVCLRLGDLTGYRDACAALVRRGERFRTPNEFVPGTAEVVWPCCLCPTPGADPVRLRQFAERAAEIKNGNGMEYYPLVRALGASHYRAGEYEKAVEVLGKATTLNNQAPTVWLLLAMCYHQLGNAAEARRALDAARTWMAQSTQDDRLTYCVGWVTGIAAAPGGGFAPVGALGFFAGFPLVNMSKGQTTARPWRDIPWQEQQALELLRLEAENLIAGNPPGR
jgi:Flp pilus assembly protein TadD